MCQSEKLCKRKQKFVELFPGSFHPKSLVIFPSVQIFTYKWVIICNKILLKILKYGGVSVGKRRFPLCKSTGGKNPLCVCDINIFSGTEIYHPQLYTCIRDSEYAVVWSAPQVMDTISWPSNEVISVGNNRSSASPWPNCPSSPRPQEQATFPAAIQQHAISILIHWCT